MDDTQNGSASTKSLTNAVFQGNLRHLIGGIGGAMVTYGFGTAGKAVIGYAGAVVFLIALGLSWADKHASTSVHAKLQELEDAVDEHADLIDALNAPQPAQALLTATLGEFEKTPGLDRTMSTLAAAAQTGTGGVPPPGAPGTGTLPGVGLLAALLGAGLLSGCAALDPALPGQTAPAPLVATVGTNVYVLGHVVTAAEFGSAVKQGTTIGAALLVKEFPAAKIYLTDAEVGPSDFAGKGNYDAAALQAALQAQIKVKDPADQALVDSLIQTVLSVAGNYLGPLATGNATWGPFVAAGLQAEADGIKAIL